MSDLAGQLEIRLDQRSGTVAIDSSRPVTAARVFAGKSPAEVVRQLPTLFSLCGTAQAAACVGACEQAIGQHASAAVWARRQALVDAETIKEHLWRLLLDWPRMLELKAEPMIDASAKARASAFTASAAASAMPRVMRAFMALRQAQQAAADPFTLDLRQAERGAAAEIDPSALLSLVTEQALGTAPDNWLTTVVNTAALQRWSEQSETPAAALVRVLMEQGLAGAGANPVGRLPGSPWRQLARSLARPEADAFIAAPRWQRRCAETGPLARAAAQPLIEALLAKHGNGLLTRLVALLVDLAQSGIRLETATSAELVDSGMAASPLATYPQDLGQNDSDVAGNEPEPTLLHRYGRARMPARMTVSVAAPGLAHSEKPGGTGGDDARVGLGSGVGVGAAEAARGLLFHRVSIADGCVQQYQILAPTEWNFHPQGVVAQGLEAVARGGAEGPELARLARLYITAVDPCVDYQLSVS